MEKQAILEKLKEGLKTLMGTDDVNAHKQYDKFYNVMINHRIEIFFFFKEEHGQLKIVADNGSEISYGYWYDYDEEDLKEWEEKLNKLI